LFKLFRENLAKQFSARSIYLSERDKILSVPADIQERERQKIHESLLRLQNRNLIAFVRGTDYFQITSIGGSKYPEDLIWENQKPKYAALMAKNKARRLWRALLVFTCIGAAISFPYGAYVSTTSVRYSEAFWIGVSFVCLCLVFVLLSYVVDYRSSKLKLSSEDQVFIRLWEAYDSLSKFEREGKPEYRKDCIKRLSRAAKTLGAKQFASSWDMVEVNIYGAFRGLSNYIRGKTIPGVKKNEIRKAAFNVIRILSLLEDRDAAGLVGLSEEFGPTKVLVGWRLLLSWTELSSRPLNLTLVLVSVFLSALIGGSLIILNFLKEPAQSQTLLIFTTALTICVAIVLAVCLKRS